MPAAPTSAADAPGAGATTVGVITVGPKDDFGYNQAVFQGVEALPRGLPRRRGARRLQHPRGRHGRHDDGEHGRRRVRRSSSPPPTATSTPPSRWPPPTRTSSSSTRAACWTRRPPTWAPTSAPCTSRCTSPGIAAGAATETGKLGYVYAIPIPQTLANINAFTLGAQTVQPDVEVITVSTTSWCDPATQANRVQSLLSSGVDVVTQHQDCTKTDHRGHRGGRRLHGRLPRRRLLARPEGLADRLGVELGPAVHRDRADRDRRRVHRQRVQRATTGRT